MGLRKMIFDYENKTIQVKIVYYGPAMSGKTTTIYKLFSKFNKDDQIESIESTVGRTLYFDFGVLEFEGKNWNLKLLIYSATGQDFYSGTRPSTLKGLDGIIFVMDSKASKFYENMRSWKELKRFLGIKIFLTPIVISLNKDDIRNEEKLTEEHFISEIEFEKYKSIKIRKTIATNGLGVYEAFKDIIGFIFPSLCIKIL